jgi:hypothetical protein
MAAAAQQEGEEHKQAAVAQREAAERMTAAAEQQEVEVYKQAAAERREARRMVVAELPVLAAAQQLAEAALEWVGLVRALQLHLPENRTSHRSVCHPTFYCRIGRRTYQHLLVKGKSDPIIGIIKDQADRYFLSHACNLP